MTRAGLTARARRGHRSTSKVGRCSTTRRAVRGGPHGRRALAPGPGPGGRVCARPARRSPDGTGELSPGPVRRRNHGRVRLLLRPSKGRRQPKKRERDLCASTLGENETIARLATGIKRFELPDEFNYIRIYQQVAAQRGSPQARQALENLAGIFTNRRQYPKAADTWRQHIEAMAKASSNLTK